jgi:hypothetical protein
VAVDGGEAWNTSQLPYLQNSNRWRQYKRLLKGFASDDKKQLDWASEIWNGGKL